MQPCLHDVVVVLRYMAAAVDKCLICLLSQVQMDEATMSTMECYHDKIMATPLEA